MHFLKSRILFNLIANVLGNVVGILSGLLTVPHLVASLGASSYGLWTLVGAITSLLIIIDLGVSGALGRLIAMRGGGYEGQQRDAAAVNAIMSSALAVLMVAGLGVILATFALPGLFLSLFEVPQDRIQDVTWTLLLTGFNVAAALPAHIFAGYLWGRERFDLLNMIETPLTVLRTLAILILIGPGSAFTDVTAIILASNAIGILIRAIVCIRLEPQLRLRAKFVDPGIIKDLYGFGIWYFLLSLSRSILPHIGPVILGNRIGGTAVTHFAVAKQLSTYMNSFANDATQIVAPRAAALHSSADDDRQTNLLLYGGRFATALALCLGGGAFCLGGAFLHVWQRGLLDNAELYLDILVAGELLPMSQWITYSMIVGKSQHRRLAAYAVIEGLAIADIALLLVSDYGITGICLAIAIPGCILRGLMLWIFGCRLQSVGLWEYARHVFVPVTAICAIPISLFWMIVQHAQPMTWPSLFVSGAIYLCIFCTFVLPFLFGFQRIAAPLSQIWQASRNRAQESR